MGGPPRLAAGLPAIAVLAACAACAAAVLAGCGRAGTSAGPGHPRLVITSYFPLSVRGRGFRPSETVTLSARPRAPGSKPVYARAHVRPGGVFSVRLRGRGLDRCAGFTVTAAGSSGSRATVTSPPRGCPPASPPRTASRP
jgi:hypothetical protein